MSYLDDEYQSIAMLLASAHRQLRSGATVHIEVRREPLPSQIGALLHLAQLDTVTLGKAITKKLDTHLMQFPKQFDHAEINLDLRALASWLDQSNEAVACSTKIGFWLSSFFLSAKIGNMELELTKMLMGRSVKATHKHGKKIVRRYPTGGISEKQALILPALLLSISNDFELASLFLIAGLLAHTGGTRAKLSILPGFRAPQADQLQRIDFRSNPINYVSASETVCPRDAVLYRARSETGTVEDHDLMVSSIMSKQVTVPSDVIVIDVLYGNHSFLKTFEEAKKFGLSCESVAAEFKVQVNCMYRSDVLFLPTSIGASTEILEAYEILRNPEVDRLDMMHDSELSVAMRFVRALISAAGMDPCRAEMKLKEKLSSGEAARSFIQVLHDHFVDPRWLIEFENNPTQRLLKELNRHTIQAKKTGRIRINYPLLADIVNSQINTSEYICKFGFEVSQGGLILRFKNNQIITEGDKVMNIYSNNNISECTIKSIKSTFSIE